MGIVPNEHTKYEVVSRNNEQKTVILSYFSLYWSKLYENGTGN